MPVNLPINNTFSNYSQEITLDGVSYRFEFIYNTRSFQWSMSILDIDQNPIIQGVKLVLNYELLDQYRAYENLPPGEFYCIDTTGKEKAIDRDNFGEEVELIYIPEAELDTI